MDERRDVDHPRRDEDVYVKWDARVKDVLIFGIGFFGAITEIWISDPFRPSVFGFLLGLLGFPFIFEANKRRRGDRDE